MREAFSWTRDGEQLVLAGAIDEDASFGNLLGEARDGRLVLDLGAITFINSIGVREWVRLQAAASAANVRIELRRVAEPLIHQFNIVPATRRASTVTSFFVSYACQTCDDEILVLLDVAKLGVAGKVTTPAVVCARCGAPRELSNPPELYFTFLTGGSALG